MMRAARLRDVVWRNPKAVAGEKPKSMSLGDSVHIASALWVKEAIGVTDLEFLTFDDGRGTTSEVEEGSKSLSLLRLENYTDGLGNNPDVNAAVMLARLAPYISKQASFGV